MAKSEKMYLGHWSSIQEKEQILTSACTYTQNHGSKTFGMKYDGTENVWYKTYLIYDSAFLQELNNENIKVVSIKILPINISAKSGNTYASQFEIYALKSKLEGNDENKFKIAEDSFYSATRLGSFTPNYSGNYTTSEITVNKESNIQNILNNGIVIGYNTIGTRNSQSMFDVTSTLIEVEVEYYDTTTPPLVNITSPSYYDDIYLELPMTEPLPLQWDYIQPVAPQYGYEIITQYAPFETTRYSRVTGFISGSENEYTLLPEQYPVLTPFITPANKLVTYYANLVQIWVEAYVSDTVSSELLLKGEYGRRTITFAFPKPIILSPNNFEYIMADEITQLKWKIIFENTSGKEIEANVYPTNFDIDYSYNAGETWISLVSNGTVDRGTDGIYRYDIPANTFKYGIIQYRIRAYAGGKTINFYENGYITVRVQASTSSVACDGKPMPTLSWQSSAQVAYQVRFADYDSGAIYGTATSHTIPYFYADGYYPVQVRTQASNGEWSEWTELEYVVITNSTPSNQIELTVTTTRHAIVASWLDSGVSDNYILYRNGIPIYIGADKTYTDITANGNCTYFVRAVISKYYTQSNSVTIGAYPQADCIYDFNTEAWIPLKLSMSPRTRIYSKNTNVVYNHYAGRTKPIAFTEGYTTRQMSGNYVFKTRDEALRISDLSGKRIVFKDTRGGIIIGVLNDANINVESKLYTVTFTVTETDYEEVKKYVV